MNEKKYFKGDDLAASVWRGKYALETESSPNEMHYRLASNIANMRERKTGRDVTEYLFRLFKDFKYIIPQGSIMSILGSKAIASLSNCFVVGQPEDSYGGILQKDQELVQLMKRRGGVGIDISSLRPSDTPTTNAARTSTGSVSFMERFSNSTREVAQNGRRGALMITIDIRHPDVTQFVSIKKDLTKVTGANISVKLRDDFMQAVKNNEDYILRFPCDYDIPKGIDFENELEYNNLTEVTNEIGTIYLKKVKAKDLWYEIVDNAHAMAEPGLMFLDNHWNYSPDGVYDQYKGITTNPCGEIFMQPYDACRLILQNLNSYVQNNYTDSAKIDYTLLYNHTYETQVIADDIVDLEIKQIFQILNKIKNDPEELDTKQTELNLWNSVLKVASSGRRTGCGITGLGDMLASLNLAYDSDKGLEVVDKVMYTIMKAQLTASIDMAKEYGPFEGWDASKEFYIKDGQYFGKNRFYQFLADTYPELVKEMYVYGRRNISWSTVAPAGSVSILSQTTSGIEPLFQPFYMRRKKVNPGEEGVKVDFTDQNGDTWQEFPVLHPKFKDWMIVNIKKGAKHSEEEFSKLTKEDIQKAFELSPWYGSTANDIDWTKRVELQAIVQKYTSHSISSTINLPNSASKREVSDIYMESWKRGLKGVTVYRDGCRTGVLVSNNVFSQHDAPKRPKIVEGDLTSSVYKGDKFLIIIGLLEGKPYEVFAAENKGGSFKPSKVDIIKKKRGHYDIKLSNSNYIENFTSTMTDEEETVCRLISTSLRHGADIKFIVEQLNKTFGEMQSLGKVLARTLKRYISDGELVTGSTCQSCGSSNIIYEEGCNKCLDCGSSKC